MPILGVIASSIAKIGSFESIATATGNGSSDTISFSSIPSTFKHLQVRWNARAIYGSELASDIYIYLNADTASNYSYHYLLGNGSAASANAGASTAFGYCGVIPFGASGTVTMGTGICDILDYASTTKNKTIRTLSGEDRNGSGNIYISSSLWRSTSAVNQIQIKAFGSSGFTTSTTFALYGIKEA